MAHYGDYQNAIYIAGLSGVIPRLPVDFATLEQRASAAMPPAVLNYVQGGCGDEYTQRANAEGFQRWGIVPRMMVDCRERDLSIELFGMRLPTPVFMYGMEPGEEVSIDIERGKTLIVKYLTVGDPHEDGGRTVFAPDSL